MNDRTMKLYLPFMLLLLTYDCLSQWQSVGGGLVPDVRGFSINADSSALIIVGKHPFTRVDSLRTNRIVQWDGANWDTAPFAGGNGDTTATAYHFAIGYSAEVFHDTLFVGYGGNYWQYDTTLKGCTFLANGVWQSCGETAAGLWLSQSNGRLFGGSMLDTTMDGTTMYGLNEWVNGKWQRPKNSPFHDNAQIYATTYWNGSYYAAGSFYALGTFDILQYDGDSTWTPLDSGIFGGWPETVQGFGDSLYVGGFINQHNPPSDHIMIWDGNDWLPFFPQQVEYYSRVTDILVHNEMMYVSGLFNFVGDTTRYGVLRYDGHQICALGGYMPHPNRAMIIFNNDLYSVLSPGHAGLEGEYLGMLDLDTTVPDTCVQVIQTHVSEMQADRQVFIHPNPARTSVTINCPSCIGATQVSVFNVLGEQMLSGTVAPSQMNVAVDQLRPGTYVVRLRSQDGEAWYGRFVKH